MESDGKGTIQERIRAIYRNHEMYDIVFSLRNGDEFVQVKGHTLIFAIASPVFKKKINDAILVQGPAIFREGITSNPCRCGKETELLNVTIEDINLEVFKTIKRFIYTDELQFSSFSHATYVLETAKKYNITKLKEVTEANIESTIDSEYVYTISDLPSSNKPTLEKRFSTIFERNPVEIINHENFLDFDIKALEKIVQLDNLETSEINLFKAIERWAIHNSRKNGIPMEKMVERLSPVLNKIRFLCMTYNELIEVFNSPLIRNEQFIGVLTYVSKPGSAEFPQQFSTSTTQRNPHAKPRKKTELLVTWIKDVTDIIPNKRYFSCKFYFCDVPWQLKMIFKNTDEENYLSLYLHCFGGETDEDSWKIIFYLTILCQTENLGNENHHTKKDPNPCLFRNSSNGWGWDNFILWSDLIDPENEFIKDNKIKFEVKMFLVE